MAHDARAPVGGASPEAQLGIRHLQLRQLEKTMETVSDRLGLSPAARARLDLTVSKAQLAAADARTIIAGMYKTPKGTP